MPRPSRTWLSRTAVDPDVDLHDPAQDRETRPREWDLLVAIAVGGVLGAEARYGLGRALPHAVGQFPWSTLIINGAGCLCIGVLMVVLTDLTSPHRLVRPFVGVGVLGGFTTFSAFSADAEQLLLDHHPALAAGYVAGTVAVCAVAVFAATIGTSIVGSALLRLRTDQRRRG